MKKKFTFLRLPVKENKSKIVPCGFKNQNQNFDLFN